jgi:hypothetical protein
MESKKPTKEEVEKAQNRAKELGHCLCSPIFKCPCKVFQEDGTCKCAGDTSITYKEWSARNST